MLDKRINNHFQLKMDNRNAGSKPKQLNNEVQQKPNDVKNKSCNQPVFMRIYMSSSIKRLRFSIFLIKVSSQMLSLHLILSLQFISV